MNNVADLELSVQTTLDLGRRSSRRTEGAAYMRISVRWASLLMLMQVFVLGALNSPAAQAHSTGQSYVFLTMNGDSIDVRVEVVVGDLNKALDLALPEDDSMTMEILSTHVPVIRRYVNDRLTLADSNERLAMEASSIEILSTMFGQFVQVGFVVPGLVEQPESIDVSYGVLFDVVPEHTAFLVVENNWLSSTFDNEAEFSLVFTADEQTANLDLSESSVLRGFNGMVAMGMHHIWTGIDHVLFLIALLLPSVMRRKGSVWVPVDDLKTALIQVVKVVTVFTVAHTITLSLAALDVVNLPSRLVESVIAISIAIVAVDIVVPMFRNWVFSVVLAFGLFHGFGFATVLAEMPIPSSYMVLSLLGFNLGVEIGQIAIVAAVVPVLFLLRRWRFYPRLSMPAGAAVLIVISLYWFIERAFDVDLPAGAIANQLLSLV